MPLIRWRVPSDSGGACKLVATLLPILLPLKQICGFGIGTDVSWIGDQFPNLLHYIRIPLLRAGWAFLSRSCLRPPPSPRSASAAHPPAGGSHTLILRPAFDVLVLHVAAAAAVATSQQVPTPCLLAAEGERLLQVLCTCVQIFF